LPNFAQLTIFVEQLKLYKMSVISIKLEVVPQLHGYATGGGLKSTNDSVTLTPYANANRYFKNWILPDGSTSTSNPLTFTATVNATYKVVFEQYAKVKVLQNPEGTVTGENFFVKKSDTVTLEATPITGFTFVGYFLNGNLLSSASSYSFKTGMDMDIEPRFTKADTGTTLTTVEHVPNFKVEVVTP
jgi:hypothetical protein